MTKKVTQKEWRQFIEQGMVSSGFTRKERDTVRSVFHDPLHDVDYGEKKPFLGQPQPGITQPEAEEGMNALRGKVSEISRGLKTKVDPTKLDKLEGMLHEAIDKNKERWF